MYKVDDPVPVERVSGVQLQFDDFDEKHNDPLIIGINCFSYKRYKTIPLGDSSICREREERRLDRERSLQIYPGDISKRKL